MATIIDAVRDCSATAITDLVINIKNNHFPNGRWLDPKNRYSKNTIERIKKGRIYQSHLGEYIAASAILHCYDGWSYIARSLEAIQNGELSIAIHLAYYAELRAAMSFLASEGIGIFNDKHYYVDSNGSCNQFTGNGRRIGTHKITPDVLREWAAQSGNGQKLSKLLQINGFDFDQWLRSAGLSSSRLVAKEWLESWSIDLEQVERDQNIRNMVSYRPQRIFNNPGGTVADNFVKLLSFWRAFEPLANGTVYLDLQLLHRALLTTYQTLKHRYPSQNRNGYKSFITNTLSNLGLNGNQSLMGILQGTEWETRYPILAEAKKPLFNGDVPEPFPIIARALMFLRISSAACKNIISATGILRNELAFWWRSTGCEFGLWEPGNEPTQSMDLWSDIEMCISEIDDWCNSNNNPNKTILHVMQHQSTSMQAWQLHQFQRAGFWTIGL